jgi:uncharacterized protein YcfJ
MKRLKIIDNKGRVYPFVEDGILNYVRYPVQKTNGKWVCAQVLAGGGYLSVEQQKNHVEYDEFETAQAACRSLNYYFGWDADFVNMILSVSMRNSMCQEAMKMHHASITPSEYAGLACDMMYRVAQDNGAINKTEGERYPAELVNAIALAAEVFFAANAKYLTPTDVEAICAGNEEEQKKYKKKKGWAALRNNLDFYFNTL